MKNFLERVLKMLLSEPLASLITFFRTSLITFYHNSQRMSDSFFHITESSEINEKIRFQNILILTCKSAMFWNFCVGKHRLQCFWPMTSWNLTSHVFETRKFVMAILHWKQGLLCDKYKNWKTTKNFGPCQPERTATADMGRYLSHIQ